MPIPYNQTQNQVEDRTKPERKMSKTDASEQFTKYPEGITENWKKIKRGICVCVHVCVSIREEK